MHLVGILFPHINDDARSKSHQIILYIHTCTCEGTRVLSLPLHTLQYVQSFPPSILCTVHYNPYTPLYISFSFLGGFLATSENTLACSWPHTLHFYKQNRNYFSINLSYLSATHINEQFHVTVLSKYNRHALIVIHNNYTYTLSSTF